MLKLYIKEFTVKPSVTQYNKFCSEYKTVHALSKNS